MTTSDPPTSSGSSRATSRGDGYSPDRRTALILTGTGADGVYHAGVLRALHEAGIKIDLVAGRGIGAVGAVLTAVDGGARLWDAKGIVAQSCRPLSLPLALARASADRRCGCSRRSHRQPTAVFRAGARGLPDWPTSRHGQRRGRVAADRRIRAAPHLRLCTVRAPDVASSFDCGARRRCPDRARCWHPPRVAACAGSPSVARCAGMGARSVRRSTHRARWRTLRGAVWDLLKGGAALKAPGTRRAEPAIRRAPRLRILANPGFASCCSWFMTSMRAAIWCLVWYASRSAARCSLRRRCLACAARKRSTSPVLPAAI